MNRTGLLVAILCALVVVSQAASVPSLKVTRNVELDLCPTCVSFAENSINELLNIILNAGVVGGCSELCGMLKNKLEATVCNLLCDYVGITEFIKAIEAADLDPIYMCELIRTCPIADCTGQCVSINSINVQPPSGPQGTTFNIDVAIQAFNQTSTGEIVINISPPDGEPFGDGELVPKGFQPGNYNVRFQLQAEPNEQEPFSAGTYGVEIAVCEGECGSKHPHSAIYDIKKSSFQITGR